MSVLTEESQRCLDEIADALDPIADSRELEEWLPALAAYMGTCIRTARQEGLAADVAAKLLEMMRRLGDCPSESRYSN